MFTDSSQVIIQQGTEFRGNKASNRGGAIDFQCSNYGADFSKCKLTITEASFVNNFAADHGGAINWNVYEPSLTNSNFSNNRAGLFGRDIAANAKRLIRITHEQLQMDDLSTFLNSARNTSSYVDAKSGGSATYFFALVDKYGQVMRADNQSTLFIRY